MPPPYAVKIRTPDGWQDIALQGRSVAIFEQPAAPTTAVNGDIWIDTDAPTPQPAVGPKGDKGDPGAASTVPGPPGPPVGTIRIGQTWAVTGGLTAGMNIGAFFVPIAAGHTMKVVGARAQIGSGTSIGIQLQRNLANVGGVMTVVPTPATFTITPTTLADGDRISLVFSAPVGTPLDLNYTVYMEHGA